MFRWLSTCVSCQSPSSSAVGKGVLLRARHHPFIPFSSCDGLHASDVATRERFCDRQSNVLLTSQDVGNITLLELRGAEVENRRESDNTTIKQAINKTSCAKASKLGVQDELPPAMRVSRQLQPEEACPPHGSNQTPQVSRCHP